MGKSTYFHYIAKIIRRCTSKIIEFMQKQFMGLLARLADYVATGRKSSAFSPYVKLTVAISLILCVIIYGCDSETIDIICVLSIVLLIVFGIVIYFIFVFTNPQLLQSESFRIQEKKRAGKYEKKLHIDAPFEEIIKWAVQKKAKKK